MNEPILEVSAVSKKFCRSLKRSLLYGLSDIASEIAGSKREKITLRKNEFWALDDVSISLSKGEAIGLVGANGSGKTTLLKLISGLIKIDHGNIKVSGRIVPLIALGAGFKPILTGRENIFVNLAILGLSDEEIRSTVDNIISFAEIGEAIDAPLQTYSSGMAARLGFACAVHAKADILLIDEVLSVGDMRFRSKCYRKLAELRAKGTSFILVSHNTNAILSICNKAFYLKKGKLVGSGEPSTIMAMFEEDLCLQPGKFESEMTLAKKADALSSGLDISKVNLSDEHGQRLQAFKTGEFGKINIEVELTGRHSDVILSILIKELSGESGNILALHSDQRGVYYSFGEDQKHAEIIFPKLRLKPGIYTAKIYFHKKPFFMLDAVESFVFKVTSEKPLTQCLYDEEVRWN